MEVNVLELAFNLLRIRKCKSISTTPPYVPISNLSIASSVIPKSTNYQSVNRKFTWASKIVVWLIERWILKDEIAMDSVRRSILRILAKIADPKTNHWRCQSRKLTPA